MSDSPHDSSTSEAQSRTIVSVLTDEAHLVNIRTFVVAARYLSFKAAAHFLYLTPGAVSHRLAKLEEALGFPLFNRLTRGLSLTQEGERLNTICLDAFMRFSEEICTQVGHTSFSTLTLYSHQSIAISWLIPRLADFRAQHPAAQLNLQTGNALMSFNATTLVDIAIYYANSTFTGLCSEKFMDEESFPVCSPDYAAQHNLGENPQQLTDCTLLNDGAAWHFSSPFAEWQEWCQEHDVNIGPRTSTLTFDTSIAAAIAACNHLGVAIGRRHIVQSMLDEHRLIRLFPALPALATGFGYYAVWPRAAYQPPKVAAFLDWLRQVGN